MRVGLISDTHGDPVAFDKAVDALGRMELLLHAGDVLYHGVFNPILDTYDPRRLADLLNSVEVPMLHARGNCDSEVDQMALENHILSDFALARVDGAGILITHGHKHSEKQLAGLASRERIGLVFRGHTHVPDIKVIDGVMLVNAGSPSLPKQKPEVPTAGVIEDGIVKVLDIGTGEVLLERGIQG